MGPQSAKFNAAFLFGPIFCALLLAINFQVQLALIFVVGFILFLRAKISIIKKGSWMSFGAKEMSPAMRKSYYIGYATMIVSGVISVFLAKYLP